MVKVYQGVINQIEDGHTGLLRDRSNINWESHNMLSGAYMREAQWVLYITYMPG